MKAFCFLEIAISLLAISCARAEDGRIRKGRPPPEQDGTARSYRCAFSAFEAQQYTSDQCADANLFCFDGARNRPGSCDRLNDKYPFRERKLRCFQTTQCTYAPDTSIAPPRTSQRKERPEYKCIDDIEQYTFEQCVHAIPCQKVVNKQPLDEPDDMLCLKHDGGRHKCHKVSCSDAGKQPEPLPTTTKEGEQLGYEVIKMNPHFCRSKSHPQDFDCDTATPCDSVDDKTKADASRCTEHHDCVLVEECMDLHLAFANHVKILPGLYHEHQTMGGHKVVRIPPKRCIPNNRSNDPTVCDEVTPCVNGKSCKDGFKCDDMLCPYWTVLHKKTGPDNDHIPYDHPTMADRCHEFTHGDPAFHVVGTSKINHLVTQPRNPPGDGGCTKTLAPSAAPPS